jgi:glutaredoxin
MTTTSRRTQKATDFIEEKNRSYQVVIWSKSFCPYCDDTKRLFRALVGIENVAIVEIDTFPCGTLIQQQLLRMTGQRTVPNIFVHSQHMGGHDKVRAATQTGTLQQLLVAQQQPQTI